MNFEEFAAAVRHAYPDIGENEIRRAFKNGDKNDNRRVSYDEFMHLVDETEKKEEHAIRRARA